MGCAGTRHKKTKETNKLVVVSIKPGQFIKHAKSGLPEEYEIISDLASGAFAQVKLSIHKPTGQKRAVKFINKRGLQRDDLDENLLLKEVKILRELNHPSILRCFEIYEDTHFFYVVTEFCEGGELFKRLLKKKRFDEKEASFVMQQVLSAVAHCHDRLVIHRDIKPENVLLEDDSLNVKVADFGSSCIIDPGKRLSGCFGSAYYVAPEVITGEFNEKCDVWSCGVLMYIMLTGNPPYPGKDAKRIMKMIKTNPLRIERHKLPLMSPQGVDLMQKMLTVDISERISAREALNHEWIANNFEINSELTETLDKLKEFRAASKLKDAVHMYIAAQVISQEDLKELKEKFMVIDKNGDGTVSRCELLEKYNEIMSAKESMQTVENIFNEADSDQSGDIDYAEFLKACMDASKYASIQNLQVAFKAFDRDGSGDITVQELKDVLSGTTAEDDQLWGNMLKDADDNQDGVIDLKEFMELMNRSL